VVRISDPLPFMGISSGIQVLTVTAIEGRTLMRAVAILEAAHDLVSAKDVDHDGVDELTDALCLAPPAIRELVENGLTVS
jgi:hypothetical protein